MSGMACTRRQHDICAVHDERCGDSTFMNICHGPFHVIVKSRKGAAAFREDIPQRTITFNYRNARPLANPKIT